MTIFVNGDLNIDLSYEVSNIYLLLEKVELKNETTILV